jgi:hypothetical protein
MRCLRAHSSDPVRGDGALVRVTEKSWWWFSDLGFCLGWGAGFRVNLHLDYGVGCLAGSLRSGSGAGQVVDEGAGAAGGAWGGAGDVGGACGAVVADGAVA